mmetsp:Transcript_5686/g.8328  ORF Transcript_5686/g.8328 Transcript_5686/m.8328 type:complete len:294 (+) Transcript_5686:136-1017(+)|eukprot:CAMPEP_0196819814 /NCGR_PEP_ID=MMETSP1362-20130617/72250_1 /TAXON_ID=163516 /ORGANISM="Leptocylindrus danicus, Strain CCMP1856" /LENGTH=293 /DNA_ID=CAMNT_0042198423 /DNA_START=81 /DNA_END=962 /DNA_ORIENTATION=+
MSDTKKSMEDILDEALDGLDDESSDNNDHNGDYEGAANTPSAASAAAVPVTPRNSTVEHPNVNATDINNAINVKEMEEAMKALLNNMGGAGEPTDGTASTTSGADAALEESISKLLSGMQMPTGLTDNDDDDSMPDMDSAQIPQMGEDIMEQMMHEFAKMGNGGAAGGAGNDFDSIVDGMMKQLLAKELMYEPMKSVCDKFPEWLADAKERLSEEDYNRYGHQYQYFQRIVAVYETDPDNFSRLLELMQDIQEYGQPPAEIIKELAPGLDFDVGGMPMMPGLTGGGEPQCPTM